MLMKFMLIDFSIKGIFTAAFPYLKRLFKDRKCHMIDDCCMICPLRQWFVLANYLNIIDSMKCCFRGLRVSQEQDNLPLHRQTQTLFSKSSLSPSPARWQVWHFALSGISPTAGLEKNHITLFKNEQRRWLKQGATAVLTQNANVLIMIMNVQMFDMFAIRNKEMTESKTRWPDDHARKDIGNHQSTNPEGDTIACTRF